MAPNPPGWRRLWPSKLWLETRWINREDSEQIPVWQWYIWDAGKRAVLACGAESYTRQTTAARGGVRFWDLEQDKLDTVENNLVTL